MIFKLKNTIKHINVLRLVKHLVSNEKELLQLILNLAM